MRRAINTLLALGLIFGCSTPRPAPLPPTAVLAPTPFCFAVVVDLDGVDVDGALCASEAFACLRARAATLQLGWMAGVVSVGECIDGE